MRRTVADLFEISYGHSLSLNKLRLTTPEVGIAFVSRTARNNGVSAWVEPVPGIDPLPSGLLTVCLRSRNYALATFVQPRPFYCGYHIFVLRPKRSMSLQEKLWWAECIRANRYRYNFGRQANRSLAELVVPEEAPYWVFTTPVPDFTQDAHPIVTGSTDQLHTDAWRPFQFADLFHLSRGRRILRRDLRPGDTPYIRATAVNNGITARIDLPPEFPAGLITVSSNGSVAEAFYQDEPFIASDDIVVLTPRFRMTPAIALFLCTLIYAERYRFNYGRKWFSARMSTSQLRLPVDSSGSPDWEFIERYMKSVPMSSILGEML
jgi:hypothetical protein